MKKYTKTTIFTLLSIILVFSIAGCSLRAKQASKDIKKEGNNTEQRKDNIASTTKKNNKENQILKITGQDEKGWNIYQSEKYKFEIKMPDYFEKDISNSESYDEADRFINASLSFENLNYLWIEASDNTNNIKEIKSIEEFTKLFRVGYSSLMTRNLENIKIGDYIVTKLEETTGIRSFTIYYYLITEKYIYEFSYDIDAELSDEENKLKEKEQITREIIKTFRKID